MNALDEALGNFRRAETERLCTGLIAYLDNQDENLPQAELQKAIKMLRSKRQYEQMVQLADCCIRTGHTSYNVRRQYAQGLIEKRLFAAAAAVLHEVKRDAQLDASNEAQAEYKEATGLLGRLYKQLYVNTGQPGNPHFRQVLLAAISSYREIYDLDPAQNLWHGINIVALLIRAQADGIAFDNIPDADELSKQVLKDATASVAKDDKDIWAMATAMEACIALGDEERAAYWANSYVLAENADAFEIASTLRQLEQVWRLKVDGGFGSILITRLRAALLNKEGGKVTLSNAAQNVQIAGSNIYQERLERVFGADSYKTLKWYSDGLKRCTMVARIGRDATKGFGSGFLVEGEKLHASLAGKIVLLTNAHVVSNEPARNNKSLLPYECVVILEAVDRDMELFVESVVWSSDIETLDVSVLLFTDESHEKIMSIKDNITLAPVSKYLPACDSTQRVYIIGHPAGGTLQLSLQDNVLLAQKDPLLHYRTPTEGGSSGSPVFNDKWDLIGLHHAGDEEMPMLDNPNDTYEANEGIWIQSIIRKMKADLG